MFQKYREEQGTLGKYSWWEKYHEEKGFTVDDPNDEPFQEEGQNLIYPTLLFYDDSTEITNNSVKNENIEKLRGELILMDYIINTELGKNIDEFGVKKDLDEIEEMYSVLNNTYIHQFSATTEHGKEIEANNLSKQITVPRESEYIENPKREKSILSAYENLAEGRVISREDAEFLRDSILIKKYNLGKKLSGFVSNKMFENSRRIQDRLENNQSPFDLVFKNAKLLTLKNYLNYQMDIPIIGDNDVILNELGIDRRDFPKLDSQKLIDKMLEQEKDPKDMMVTLKLSQTLTIDE